ncbi:MAG: ATP-binding cassette domain-containing protein [Bacteroidota bacterium]|nr:ATP-binding cassette domain-containing protein [Bacteroidota bacterium]
MSIQLNNISKSYDERRVLHSVGFDIPKGEVVAFLGPNGAGKSTTMKIITGLLAADEGTAKVCGIDVSADPMAVKRLIGYLPENNPLYPDMYVREYLEFAAGFYPMKGDAKQRIDQLIEQTGLTKEQTKKIGQLSKGYRQRVGLAQALMHDPEVLILDEPTTGLDPNQLIEIRNFIRELGREKTVILSTHILQEAAAMCERTIIINEGKIVADDLTERLLRTGANRQSIEVEFLAEVLVEELESLADVINVEKISEKQYRLTAESDIRESLFRTSVEKGWVILTLTRKEFTLEELFGRLTQKG